jgi:glycosyltransferase involved in cell wall biosynthesis
MGCDNDKFSVVTRVVRRFIAKWATDQDVDYEFGTLIRDSDSVIVMSDGHRHVFASHYAPVGKKTIFVPPPPLLNMARGQDEEVRVKTRKAFGIEREDFLIAYFGYIYPPKGVETVLRAFHLVVRAHPHARLILIGGELGRECPERPAFGKEMRDLTRQLGCEEKVVWTGEFSTEGDEASRYLFAADAGVFGHDLGVAMNNSSFAALIAHGLPTVATQGTTVETPILPGDNVLLCPPKSPEAMAKALLSIIENQQLRNRLSKGSIKLATEWFSWEKATDRIIRVLTTG